MAKPENFDINRLIEYLQGTCNSLDGALSDLYPNMDHMDLTSEDHDSIDNEIFLCDTCNWWCEIGDSCTETENCGGVNCTDCCTEEHEDD